MFCLLLAEIVLLNNNLPCARTPIFKTVCGAARLLMSFPTGYKLTSRAFFAWLLLQKDSLQMPESAVSCRKKQNLSGDVALRDELNTCVFPRSPTEIPHPPPPDRLLAWKVSQRCISAQLLLSSQRWESSHVKARSSRTGQPGVARLNGTKCREALGW